MFFESRGEGWEGQEAVAKNILLRQDLRWRSEDTICGVVNSRKQYSYLWDNVPDVISISELPVLYDIQEMAYAMVFSRVLNGTGSVSLSIGSCKHGATHYHADWIDPPSYYYGAEVCGKIGRHFFYNPR